VVAALMQALIAGAVFGASVDFNRDIQPILSENCYHCHGPDAKAREAKLRLDTKDGAYRTLDGVTSIKPGDPAGSEVIVRALSDDKDEMMPPPKSNRKLTAAQKALLKRWVEEGAPWGEHWAFVAPVRPKAPRITDLELPISDWKNGADGFGDWSVNPIDAFILQKLAAEKLAPSRQAAPEEIIRRMTLDLTGLPPTLAEVDAFTAEQIRDPQSATRNLADRLLASPRYGERMVWEWLDAARYADTNGYQGDPTRAMWYWRDWAIQALNDNMPFDQFTIEQLAGDLLPPDEEAGSRETGENTFAVSTSSPANRASAREEPGAQIHRYNSTLASWLPASPQSRLIATGFHRNHMINGEGGRLAEESRVDYVQDRVETTGTVWLGLTFNCCRCHDHKYDQLTQREYYQLSAYFNSVEETGGNDAGGLANPVLSFASAEEQKKIDARKTAETEAAKAVTALEKKLRTEQPQWETAMIAGGAAQATATWEILRPIETSSVQGTTLTVQPDGSVLASGLSPDKDEYVLLAHTELGAITGFKLEVLPDDAFQNRGPGRAPDGGNFVLTEILLQASGKNITFVPYADFAQTGFDAAGTVDGKPETGWAVAPQVGKTHTLLLEAREKMGYKTQVELAFRLRFDYGRGHTLGRFRLSATTDLPARFRPMSEAIRLTLGKPADHRSDPEKEELTKFYLDTDPELTAARAKSDAAKKARLSAEKAAPRTMIMRERAQPRDTFILVKGAYNNPSDPVTHGTPAFLPPLPVEAPTNRLALARWLVAPEHPLTARVTVNRYWQTFFGRGLVKTVDDFGVQGEKPTHPELLDWLAREFIESGWDVKRLHRLIVTSAAYLQASRIPPGLAERDPENKFVARGARFRLPSWMLRDQALAVSGLLVEKTGGPPVKVYQPEGVWEDATFGQIKFAQDHGEALYRRSLYIFWRRIVAPTLFFDTANRQNCTVKTGRTNTPLHALVTLNDITYVEAARAFAERMLKQGGDNDSARVAFGFRLCTARPPRENETAILTASLDRFRQQYIADPAAAQKLIATGESKSDATLPAPELAAQTSLALLLLNLDETLSKE
jgi:hypothetical protein